MALLAPNVNSYRRITRFQVAPINVQWGYDNRTAGLRVPMSDAQSRRVENRLSGADANPYLAMAASLACGYLGMIEGLVADRPDHRQRPRPAVLAAAQPRRGDPQAARLRAADRTARRGVRRGLHGRQGSRVRVFLQVISSWEREHLLLNV